MTASDDPAGARFRRRWPLPDPRVPIGVATRDQKECTVVDFTFWRMFMKRMSHGLLVMVAVFLLHVPGAFAQVDRATLSGVVKDSGGGVVPGATVTVTNLATNLETHQQSTETGGYQVVNLIPGRYQGDVELTGFRNSTHISTPAVGLRTRS